MTHIWVGKPTTIGSDNGLSPERRQAIICTNAGILLIGLLGTNFSEISFEILAFSLKKMRLKVSSAKRLPFCPGLNVLTISFAISIEQKKWKHWLQKLWENALSVNVFIKMTLFYYCDIVIDHYNMSVIYHH